MSFKILPNEVFVVEFGAIIRTRCPKDEVTDEMVHQRVVASNLAPGDTIRVQCMNHEKDTVLWFAEWLVYDRKSEMRRVDVNDRETRTMETYKHSIMRVRDWMATPAVGKTIHGKTVWVVGRGGYVIEVDGEEVGFEKDKDIANRIAAGELPLPVGEMA